VKTIVKRYDIYEEGFVVMEGSGAAHYLGNAEGVDFIDACKNYIAKSRQGEIQKDKNGNLYASEWGCRWYPTLAEAKKSFG